MNNNSENEQVKEPITVICPNCWEDITEATMKDDYIVYRCKKCGWITPQTMFYKVGKPKHD